MIIVLSNSTVFLFRFCLKIVTMLWIILFTLKSTFYYLIILVLGSVLVDANTSTAAFLLFACAWHILVHLFIFNFFSCHFILAMLFTNSLKVDFCFVIGNKSLCHLKGNFNKFTSIEGRLHLVWFYHIYLLFTTFNAITFILFIPSLLD